MCYFTAHEHYEPAFIIDAIIAIAAGFLLWISVARTKSLRRPWGIVMLVSYAVYLGYLMF